MIRVLNSFRVSEGQTVVNALNNKTKVNIKREGANSVQAFNDLF
jgi:DNA gyrase/topoisomerase IV subunit B